MHIRLDVHNERLNNLIPVMWHSLTQQQTESITFCKSFKLCVWKWLPFQAHSQRFWQCRSSARRLSQDPAWVHLLGSLLHKQNQWRGLVITSQKHNKQSRNNTKGRILKKKKQNHQRHKLESDSSCCLACRKHLEHSELRLGIGLKPQQWQTHYPKTKQNKSLAYYDHRGNV